MNIKAVASGGNAGNGGGQMPPNHIYYSGSGGGGAGATLKYSGNALTVSITNGKVTLTSSEGDNIVLNKGGTGDNYTSGSTGSGGTGGTKSSAITHNSFTETNIHAGYDGKSPKADVTNGFAGPSPPSGGAAGITYSSYGKGAYGTSSQSGATASNQSVNITFVLES